MSTQVNFDRICIYVLITALLITILFMNGASLGLEAIRDEDAERYSDTVYFTANDQDGQWRIEDATQIRLLDEGIEITGGGAYALNESVYINNGGKYVLSGTLKDGSLIVDAYSSSKVWIMLNGVDISSSNDAALRVEQADKVFLTLADGSENTLQSSMECVENTSDNEISAAIFSRDDLTINGTGTLAVISAGKHGIKANDDLIITGGNINITAPGDGIHVNDSLRVTAADIAITAGDDGIMVENVNGFLYIESGSINVECQGDALHSNGDMLLAGGDLAIEAGDDGLHADGTIDINSGNICINECYEGVEACNINVTGGDILIYPSDDGFNANGIVSTYGDAFAAMQPGNDPAVNYEDPGFHAREEGFHADESKMETREEGAAPSDRPEKPEGSVAEMQPAGMNSIQPDPDSFNPMTEKIPDVKMPSIDRQEDRNKESANTDSALDTASADESAIRISGGAITIINAKGNDVDGLDSNGSIYISGGEIRISLTNSGTNSAIDYGSENGGVCEISGGSVIACGSYSMAEGFDSSSSQCSILYNVSEGIAEQTELLLMDEQSNVLLSWVVPCSFSSANISSPDLKTGETYIVTIGDREETITVEETAASYGDAQSSMFTGSMNWGGMQQRGGRGFGQGLHDQLNIRNEGDEPEFPAGVLQGETENMDFPETDVLQPPQGLDPGDDFASERIPGFDTKNGAASAMPSENGTNETNKRYQTQDDSSGQTGYTDRRSDTNTSAGHGNHGDKENSPAETKTNTEGNAATESGYSATTYVETIVCVLILFTAIVFAKRYRRY